MPHLAATNAAASALLVLTDPSATVVVAAAINAVVAVNAVSTNPVVVADSVAANAVKDNTVTANAVVTNTVVTNVVATTAVVTNVVGINAARVHQAVTVGACIELTGKQRSEGGVTFITQFNVDRTFNVRWVLANPHNAHRIRATSPAHRDERRAAIRGRVRKRLPAGGGVGRAARACPHGCGPGRGLGSALRRPPNALFWHAPPGSADAHAPDQGRHHREWGCRR